MDANKDGVVTKEELTTLLKGLGEDVTDEVIDEMIKIADENGDGKIQFEEFVKAATEGNMWDSPASKDINQWVLWPYWQATCLISVSSQTTNWNALSPTISKY